MKEHTITTYVMQKQKNEEQIKQKQIITIIPEIKEVLLYK
jgi:hypothetical protein